MMSLFKSLFIPLTLALIATASVSASSSVIDYLSDSDVAVNVYVYRKEKSGYYRAKIKRVYKGCQVEQYDTILIDPGTGGSCGLVNIYGRKSYLLFGHIAALDNAPTGPDYKPQPTPRPVQYAPPTPHPVYYQPPPVPVYLKPVNRPVSMPVDDPVMRPVPVPAPIRDDPVTRPVPVPVRIPDDPAVRPVPVPVPVGDDPVSRPNGGMATTPFGGMTGQDRRERELMDTYDVEEDQPPQSNDQRQLSNKASTIVVLKLKDCAPVTRIDYLSRSERNALQGITPGSCSLYVPDERVGYGSYGGCSPRDCGQLPYNSSPIHCPDGSTAGFTNKCVAANGGCEWEILKCPVCDCGQPKPTFQCHDGSTVGGKPLECKTSSNGSCSWTYSTCPACTNDYDCVAIENGICKEGTCEQGECSDHSHCADDEVCEYGYCVKCTCHNNRSEYLCDDGKTYGDRPDYCTRKSGRCEYVYTECAPCKVDADCAGLDYGICKYGQCEEGEKPCECVADREPYKCHDRVNFGGEPYDCQRTSYGKCEYSYTECEDCHYDDDCAALGELAVCKDGQCTEAECRNDEHCADDELCVDHYCVKCDCGKPSETSFLCHDKVKYGNKPEECSRRDDGKCSWSYSTCDQCYSDKDCHALTNGVCKDGECTEAQCLVDSDCEHDELCKNHYCVKCDCGQPTGKSFLCHDKVSYGNEPEDCLRREDGKCSWSYSVCPPCDNDYDCEHGFYCVAGTCSNTKPYSGVCHSDDDCNDGEYCAAGECLEVGSCQSRDDCYNPSNEFDYDLPSGCKGPRFACSYGECKASCCPQQPSKCYAAPCDTQKCKSSKLASCANDYCGGCKARFFTYDGSPTCLGY